MRPAQDKRSQRRRECRDRSRHRNREWLYQYMLSHPCVDCGEDNPVMLVPDHVDGKTASLSHMVLNGASIANLAREMGRCVIRCCNCHASKTSKEQGWYAHKRNLGLDPGPDLG